MNLSALKVKDVMVERHQIKYLSTEMTLHEALAEAHLHHHARFPLIKGKNLDEVVGYINFKDMICILKINPHSPSLQGISRPVLSVIENEPLPQLLNRLIQGHQHIAIVKNAEEKVSGGVTLEDVIEAVIGNVSDEYDIMPSHCYEITPQRYLAGGGISVKSLNEKTGLRHSGEAQNLSDWIIEKAGRLPKADERLILHNQLFAIRKIRRFHPISCGEQWEEGTQKQ